jgi:hypothetical protein
VTADIGSCGLVRRIFQLFDCDRVRRMPIDVDDEGLNPPGLRDGKLEKALGRKRIARGREGEIRKSMVLPAESMA